MPRCSRHSNCTTCEEIRTSLSAGRSSSRDHLSPPDRSSHRFDDVCELVEYLADLTFTHNQRRAERQRIADGTEHDIVFKEAQFERLHAALADRIGLAGEINADGQPH